MLTGCASGLFSSRTEQAEALAAAAGWSRLDLNQNPFVLTAFVPAMIGSSETVTIYLEGDGLAFLSRTEVSGDPTPRDAVALRLALADDKTGTRAYLGRPCQYLKTPPQRCGVEYWTSHRYAPEVVTALDGAIEQLKRRVGAARVRLVGYSGGGALAVLVAARRTDVEWLVTVAANLDHGTWTRLREITPLTGSLDAVDAAERVASIPQVHVVGDSDEVVPRAVTDSYMRHLPAGTPARVLTVPGLGHHDDWSSRWRSVLSQCLSLIAGRA